MGQLLIEGDSIERLTFARRIGDTDTFDAAKPPVFEHPGASVSMPAGQYFLRLIELRGGYTSQPYIQSDDGKTGKVPPDAEWLTISPDRPCTLQAGAPLKLQPYAYRQGRVIRLSFGLLDARGRGYYASAVLPRLPQFVVYQGDREIATSDSMSLEYG